MDAPSLLTCNMLFSCQDVGMLEIPAELSARLRSASGELYKKLNQSNDLITLSIIHMKTMMSLYKTHANMPPPCVLLVCDCCFVSGLQGGSMH